MKGKTIFKFILFFGTIISLYFVPWPIVFAWLKPIPKTVQEQVDLAAEYGFDGIVVCINTKENGSSFYCSGYKNTEKKIPADPNTLFKIASVGKLYNALAVVKLATSGKLDLDEKLSAYLPELKNRIEYADQITLRMLVMHRSGFPNFTDTPSYWSAPKETSDDNLALVLDQPANFTPNSDYEYCNTNYLLINKIISRVLGYSTFDYIQESILNPLQLHHTFGSIYDVDIEDVMSGYYVGYDADLKTDNIGSMLSNAEDLSKFIRALNDGSAYSTEREELLYRSLYPTEHIGLIPGYQTIAEYHPENDMVVVQFTNTVDFEGYNWNMSELMYNRIVRIEEMRE